MAFKNKSINNKITGQDIRFIRTGKETNGQLLEMEITYNSYSKEPPPHYHPFQVEDFTVISGELTVRIDGELRILKQGDILHIPVNKAHSMWNNSNQKTVVNWKVQPAMNTEYFLETTTGLANDGMTNNQGIPNIFRIALIGNKYGKVFRLAKPPFIVQKLIFTLLTPISHISGNKIAHNKYVD